MTPNYGLPFPACPDCQPCPNCPGGLDAFENLARATDTALAGVAAQEVADVASLSTRITTLESFRPVVALKLVDETVNNSAVLQNDDALFVALGANRTYRIVMDVIWNSGATPDFKFDWTVPAGATGLWTVTATSGAALFLGSLSFATGGNLDGSGADLFSRFEGILNTTNAGTLQFRWAQLLANASNTIVRANSLLVAYPVI